MSKTNLIWSASISMCSIVGFVFALDSHRPLCAPKMKRSKRFEKNEKMDRVVCTYIYRYRT